MARYIGSLGTPIVGMALEGIKCCYTYLKSGKIAVLLQSVKCPVVSQPKFNPPGTRNSLAGRMADGLRFEDVKMIS